MKFVFRADASPRIGGGHVMRCLTLADQLAGLGHECVFAVREGGTETVPKLTTGKHQVFELTGDEKNEAEQIAAHIDSCDWLIVDHYGRSEAFEQAARHCARHIMVIDDLADRKHDCDLLLDQTFGRDPEDYRPLAPVRARLLTGTDYALLRPEFSQLRPRALQRRKAGGEVKRIMISLGASDPEGVTARVLRAIGQADLDVELDVVTGNADPADLGLTEIAATMPQPVRFHSFDANMAQLMCEADLAVGAGGSTSWERCCLGLPSITLVLADNQRMVAAELEKAGAVKAVYDLDAVSDGRFQALLSDLSGDQVLLSFMSAAAESACDGRGAERIGSTLLAEITTQPAV